MSSRLIVLLLVGCIATGCDRQKEQAPQAPAAAADTGKGIDRSHKGEVAPATLFVSPDGERTSIATFKGQPVLINLWASWCAPCVKELPTLQALETRHAGDGHYRVIAISQDNGPQGSVDAFLASKKIGRFAAYHDPDMALSGALGVQILPSTILYDAAGKEVWRYTGDMDWTSVEARKLVAEATNP